MDAKFQVTCTHIVGYPTVAYTLATCPRCLGNGYYNASSFGTDGKMTMLSGANLLIQQMRKILTEEKRPTGYGFDYTVLTGTINDSTVTAVKSEVMRCLQYLSDSQQQEKLEGYNYLPTEEIASISSIDAFISDTDPRQLFVNAAVFTKAGTLISTNNVSLRR